MKRRTETDVLRLVRDFAAMHRWWPVIRLNPQFREGEHGRRFIAKGSWEPGLPDFLIGLPRTMEIIAVECKTDSGKLSDAQRKWRADWEASGRRYFVVRGVEDLEGIL